VKEAIYPVAVCGESRSLGSEWEGWEAIPRETPNHSPSLVQASPEGRRLSYAVAVSVVNTRRSIQ